MTAGLIVCALPTVPRLFRRDEKRSSARKYYESFSTKRSLRAHSNYATMDDVELGQLTTFEAQTASQYPGFSLEGSYLPL